MNEIIKNIEAAQLKENVGNFSVGDTVKVYATRSKKETVKEFRFLKAWYSRDRAEAQEKHLQ